MARLLLRPLALFLAGAASCIALTAVWARMDSWDEVAHVPRLDAALGVAFTPAFLSFFAPRRAETSQRRRLLFVVSAGLVGLCTSGPLLWMHWEQYRICSTR